MSNNLMVYYLPVNSRGVSGKSYALYMNNNTNLDLSSISEKNDYKKDVKDDFVVLDRNDYSRLEKINNRILTYIEEEKKKMLEVTNISSEFLEILNKIVGKIGL